MHMVNLQMHRCQACDVQLRQLQLHFASVKVLPVGASCLSMNSLNLLDWLLISQAQLQVGYQLVLPAHAIVAYE